MTLFRILAAAAAIAVATPAPLAAQAGICGANAVETGRSESNGQIKINCQCAAGHVKSGGVCVAVKSGTTTGSYRLLGLTATGTVSVVLPDGRRLDANSARGTDLVAGTRFVTGAGSSATLTFSGQSKVLLGENTVFAVEVPPGKLPFSMRLASGMMELIESGRNKGRIRMPAIVAAVRGTVVSLRTSAAGSQVTLKAGAVDLLDRNGKLVLSLKPGQTVDVSPDGKVGAPRAVQ